LVGPVVGQHTKRSNQAKSAAYTAASRYQCVQNLNRKIAFTDTFFRSFLPLI
jgi:hypothetical protein